MAKSGDIWYGGPLPAPKDAYVLLRRFNGWWETGRAAYGDSFFLDVYNTMTGKRVALIEGTWFNYTPDGVLRDALWIPERDLVFPFGADKRDIVVCRV